MCGDAVAVREGRRTVTVVPRRRARPRSAGRTGGGGRGAGVRRPRVCHRRRGRHRPASCAVGHPRGSARRRRHQRRRGSVTATPASGTSPAGSWTWPAVAAWCRMPGHRRPSGPPRPGVALRPARRRAGSSSTATALTDKWVPGPTLVSRDPIIGAATLLRDAGTRHDDASVVVVGGAMDIVTLDANRPEDLFAVRAGGRAIVARLGLDETGPGAAGHGAERDRARGPRGRPVTSVVFSVEDAPVPAVVVTFDLVERGGDLFGAPPVWRPPAGWVDGVELQEPPVPAIRVVKHLSRPRPRRSQDPRRLPCGRPCRCRRSRNC